MRFFDVGGLKGFEPPTSKLFFTCDHRDRRFFYTTVSMLVMHAEVSQVTWSDKNLIWFFKFLEILISEKFKKS